MATDTRGFQSKFKRDRTTGGVASRGRRVFEGTEERTTSSVASSGVSGSYKTIGGDKTDSVTSRINSLNINDDNKNSDNEETTQIEKNDEEGESTSSRHSHKKDRGAAGGVTAKKRQKRKNLREKRRSTGVVIMPDQPTIVADDDEKVVQQNTAMNTNAVSANSSSSSLETSDDVKKQLEAYELAIEDWTEELAKAKKEIEALQRDNQRLKDENSALMRVVKGLSESHKK